MDRDALVEEALDGGLSPDTAAALVLRSDAELPTLLAAADAVRRHHFGDRVRFCSIVNARSNLCGEDCGFCSQSCRSTASVPAYPLMDQESLLLRARQAREDGADRFSVVTSGKGPGPAELDRLEEFYRVDTGMERCASIGVLRPEDLRRLKDAGLENYHHNLEAAPRFYEQIVTTRSFQDNVDALRAAKAVGLTVCCGGIFGMGETWDDRIELFRILRDLDIDRAPLNFLHPIPGTPLGDRPLLQVRDALRIIALARLMLPGAHVILAGGRELVLGASQPLAFLAGATGLLLGDYLTTKGRSAAEDLEMIRGLGLTVSHG